jgi:hypothetical protein
MLFSTSSIFELYVVVAIVVMYNNLDLIMEIVHNYPSIQKPNGRQFPELKMAGFTDGWIRLPMCTLKG